MKSLTAYIIGFVLSIVLTLIAFGFAYMHILSDHTFPTHEMLLPLLIGLALVQLGVQLVFFLHLGREEKPKWNLLASLFALFVVFILVGGTLWIMHNLAHNQHGTLNDIYTGGDITPQTEND